MAMMGWRQRSGIAAGVLLLAATGAAANSIYSNAVITTTNPALYWDLEEQSGSTAFDLAGVSGGANNGTYLNASLDGLGPQAPQYAAMEPDADPADPQNNAGVFVAGNNGSVFYNSLATTAGVDVADYSAQAWFNVSEPLNSNILWYVLGRGNGTTQNADQRDSVGVGGSYTGENVQPSKLFFFPGNSYGGGVASGTTTLLENTWYHVVLVREGDDVTVYLNGEEEISTTLAWNDNPGSPTLGERFTAGNRVDHLSLSLGITGNVDEVAVWDEALTAEQVQGLYTLAVPEPSTGLLVAGALLGLASARRRRR